MLQPEITQTIPGQVLKTGLEPFIGRLKLAAYRLTERPRELSRYFGKPQTPEIREVTLEDSFQVLSEIGNSIRGEKGVPENFLRQKNEEWIQVKSAVKEIIGDDVVISDYVSLDPENREHTLYLYRGGSMHALRINPENNSREGILQALETGGSVQAPDGVIKDRDGIKVISKSAELEVALRALGGERDNQELRYLTVNANSFPLRRHEKFERDGEMFEDLYHRGATRYGELTEAQRLLLNYGLRFDINEGVVADRELSEIWISTRVLGKEGRLDPGSEDIRLSASRELTDYARQVYYFDLINQYFVENPTMIDTLLESPLFLKYRDSFLNVHFAGLGQTESQLASGMLANYYLGKFEGITFEKKSGQRPAESEDSAELKEDESLPDSWMTNSPSQKFMFDVSRYSEGNGFSPIVKDFFDDFDSLVLTNPENSLAIPDTDGTPVSQIREINRIHALVRSDPHSGRKLEPQVREHAIEEAHRSIRDIGYEMKRHNTGRKFFERLKRLSPVELFEDDSETIKPFRAFVSNIVLSRIPGEGRPMMASYYPNLGYFPEGTAVLPYDSEDATTSTVDESIRHIFNGEMIATDGGCESAYESQESRIYTEGSTILKFLAEDTRVPENVRKMVQTLTNGELGEKALESLGSASDANPEVVGKFFRGGFETFRTMSQQRIVHDFIRGVEFELVKATQKWPEIQIQKWLGTWRNFDFSKVSADVLTQAIDSTLKTGSHRIDVLNHTPGVTAKTLKDIQSKIEREWFWDTNDMRFTRWKPYWNWLTTFLIESECPCPAREVFFNAHTLAHR